MFLILNFNARTITSAVDLHNMTDSKPRILVVDDDLMNVELLEGMLSRDCDVATACDGKEALLKVETTFSDLILLDVMMPGMDDCVIITNTSGYIKYVNPAFEKKYGYSMDELKEKHISIIKHQDSTLSLDKESLMQDTKHEWKGNLISTNKHGLRFNMSIKCSSILKGKRHINLVFVLREST
jgi:PAS domain S-box-containing protein